MKTLHLYIAILIVLFFFNFNKIEPFSSNFSHVQQINDVSQQILQDNNIDVPACTIDLVIAAHVIASSSENTQMQKVYLESLINDPLVPSTIKNLFLVSASKLEAQMTWLFSEYKKGGITQILKTDEAKVAGESRLTGSDAILYKMFSETSQSIGEPALERISSNTVKSVLLKGASFIDNAIKPTTGLMEAGFNKMITKITSVTETIYNVTMNILGKEIADGAMVQGLKSATIISGEVVGMGAAAFFEVISGLGLVLMVVQIGGLIAQFAGKECNCDHPFYYVNPLDVPYCMVGSCQQEFGSNYRRNSNITCGVDCGETYGNCYYSNGSWCANKGTPSCWRKPPSKDLKLKTRNTSVVSKNKSTCYWNDQKNACKFGYPSCIDITEAPTLLELYDNLEKNNSLEIITKANYK